MTIKEVKRDLFTMPTDYALAHCISADFALGAGIAKQFQTKYNVKQYLYEIYDESFIPRWDKTQDRFRGGCIMTSISNIRIFNIVTKRNYWLKPTLLYIENALEWMKELCECNNVNKVAMPKIGCGLDRKQWSDVKPLIEKVFADTDIEIVVCCL